MVPSLMMPSQMMPEPAAAIVSMPVIGSGGDVRPISIIFIIFQDGR
jgi:hypothetical protein